MRVIDVDISGSTYQVHVGRGLSDAFPGLLDGVTRSRTLVLITDDNVASRYAVQLDVALAQAGRTVHSLEVPAGESSKSWAMAGELLEAIAASRLGRKGVIIAVGGGVVGDLAGFVAGVYLRGVEFVQVPTSLLAMVDSSVGGKTGVDLSAGKNLAGAFKQPLLVVADLDVLETLPDTEWRSGLAEVAKTAVLAGEEFMSWLEEHAEALSRHELDVVEEAVARCVQFKAAVVASDEKESGPRECLNYGHTLGHALEKVLGYGALSHGVAVAEGMRFAARVSVELGAADAGFVRRQDRLLDALGLPSLDVTATAGSLLQAMKSDKKVRKGTVRMVLADAPGVWHCDEVSDVVLTGHLSAWSASKSGRSNEQEPGVGLEEGTDA